MYISYHRVTDQKINGVYNFILFIMLIRTNFRNKIYALLYHVLFHLNRFVDDVNFIAFAICHHVDIKKNERDV